MDEKVQTCALSGGIGISKVVDITNYVLKVRSARMHAFDYAYLGDEINVRRADDMRDHNIRRKN